MEHDARHNNSAVSPETRVLDRLQRHIPLVPQPYRAIAEELGLAEDDVLRHVQALKDRRLLRQLAAIFDAAALGYRSSLVAARYDPAAIDEAAALVSSHPGVSHNYQRDHDFNLWYTIAVPPGHSLEETTDRLHRLSSAQSTRLLPTLRRFKLGVRLDVAGDRAAAARESTDEPESSGGPSAPLTERDIRAVRALQDDLPVTSRPFDALAERESFDSVEELLDTAEDLRRRGAMRRFSGVVRHREAGFSANGMAVWVVEEGECERLGPIMAGFASVSHCYQRPTYPDWPYSLFTMIHGRSAGDVQECIDAIREATGLDEYSVLYSTVEYKKRRVRYFTGAWDEWDRQHAPEVTRT